MLVFAHLKEVNSQHQVARQIKRTSGFVFQQAPKFSFTLSDSKLSQINKRNIREVVVRHLLNRISLLRNNHAAQHLMAHDNRSECL